MESGSMAADRLLRSPIFCFQGPKTGKNAGVLFAFLCTCKETQKGLRGKDSNHEHMEIIVFGKMQLVFNNINYKLTGTQR